MMTYLRLCALHKKADLPPPCPSCFSLWQESILDEVQDILPLRGGALDALSRTSRLKICRRCQAMETFMGMAGIDEALAFAPAFQDWAEAIRLPGVIEGGWGASHYPTGGLEDWLAYCRKRDAAIKFYREEDVV